MSLGTIVRVRTHAKVNLFLRVLGARRDGYHEVETILHSVGLYDELRFAPSEGEVHVAMEFRDGIEGSLPSEADNLVTRAVDLLRGRAEIPGGIEISVSKGIPVGAGLGGGSSNAAGVLTILCDLWNVALDRDALVALAAELGSDVPFCIEGGTVLARARGEKLTPLPQTSLMWFVLAGNFEPLLSRDVYAAWDTLGSVGDASSTPMTMALGAGDTAEVAALLHNDLEPAAISLQPALRGQKEALLSAGCLGAAVSGSGPTLYGIADDEDHARSIAAAVSAHFEWVEVVSSKRECVERLD